MKRIETDSYVVAERVGDLGNFEKTLTQQNFAADVDVNNIVARAIKTGFLADPAMTAVREAIFADVSEVGDYAACLNRISAAQDAFMSLPADLRASFGNDPAQLLAFLADPANNEKAMELGLKVRPPAPVMPNNGPNDSKPAVPVVPTTPTT